MNSCDELVLKCKAIGLFERIGCIPADHVRGYSLWWFAAIPLGWLVAFALAPFTRGNY